MVRVLPNVARYTIEGTYLGVPCVNVLDYYNASTVVADRGERVKADAEQILNIWAARMLPVWTYNYVFEAVSWIDLDSPAGSVGTVTSTDITTLPKTGLGGGQPYSGAMTTVVNKDAVRSRGTRRGRICLAPGPESGVVGNILEPAYQADVQTAVTNFLVETTLPDATPGYRRMVVIHREGLTPAWSEVTGLSVQSRMGTQRRRLRGDD